MKTRKLNTSQQRIKYFRDELEKMRISFFNDSITFVIDRVNIVQDTLNQISTTDRFDFHKELKIFFIDEVAQDAGGILREWISYLIQEIFSQNCITNNYDEETKKEPSAKPKRIRRSYTFSESEQKQETCIGIEEGSLLLPRVFDKNHTIQRIHMKSEVGRNFESDIKSVEKDEENNLKTCQDESSCVYQSKLNSINAHGEIYYEFTENISSEICKLLGQIVGKAMFEDIPIEPKFTHFILKCILSQDFEVKDLTSFDPYLMSSLIYISNNFFNQSEMNLNFTVMDKCKGSVELIKNGSTLMVNNYNKYAYIRLILDYYGYHKSFNQIDNFLKGFYQVIPKRIVNILELSDLEKLICGVSKINIDDWKANTRYTGENAHSENPVVKLFWSEILTLSDSQLRKLLQFCTGSRTVPIEGFKTLKNNRQESCLFTINLVKTKTILIRAHTCFNRIELPELNKAQMKESILFILNQEDFKFDFE